LPASLTPLVKGISPTGLLWIDLVGWWGETQKPAGDAARSLYLRLKESLASPPERLFFRSYFKWFREDFGRRLPALVPQVYLHYDPYTLGIHGGTRRLPRQRMDFLMLLSGHERVVIEIDGKQHYAGDGDVADPRRYAEMVSADRQLRLAGYELYRFGAAELVADSGETCVKAFISDLFRRHGVQPIS
jgi:hypothetical protein